MVTSQEQMEAVPSLTKFVNWKLLAFYLGIPLTIGIYGAINNWGIQQAIGYSGTFVFYFSHSLVPWWITCLSTYGLMQVLRAWQPRPLPLMIAGALVGCLITIPYTNWLTQTFESAWPAHSFDGFTTHVLSTDFFIFYFRVVLIWIAVNLVFDRFIGLPRYRYDGDERLARLNQHSNATDAGDPNAQPTARLAGQPAFLARISDSLTAHEILAISAEQHYIRVYTADKEHMILYRLSDAINELGADSGMQVHRSWWVASAAISSVHRGGKKFYIRLDNELKVPVSTPHQGMVREFARNTGIPLKPAASRAPQ